MAVRGVVHTRSASACMRVRVPRARTQPRTQQLHTPLGHPVAILHHTIAGRPRPTAASHASVNVHIDAWHAHVSVAHSISSTYIHRCNIAGSLGARHQRGDTHVRSVRPGRHRSMQCPAVRAVTAQHAQHKIRCPLIFTLRTLEGLGSSPAGSGAAPHCKCGAKTSTH